MNMLLPLEIVMVLDYWMKSVKINGENEVTDEYWPTVTSSPPTTTIHYLVLLTKNMYKCNKGEVYCA